MADDPKRPRGAAAAAGAADSKDKDNNNNKEKESLFPVGIVGQRELKTALQKSRNPAETIRDFQASHSLNAMLAKAFGTVQVSKFKATRSSSSSVAGRIQEPLDTDPVMTFLSHLGVRQQMVHEKISNKLLKLLEDAIQKTDDETAVLSLLSSCWFYVTSITELEPVLLAVLKRLGKNTPPAMLQTLVERNHHHNNNNSGGGGSNNTNELKYGRIFDKLQYTLKRLCWESDWERRVVGFESSTVEPMEVQAQMATTLFYDTILPLLQNYLSNDKLRMLADLPYVESISERKILTVQRRALSKAGQQNTIFVQTGESIQQIGTLIGYASGGSLSSAALLKTSQGGGMGGAHTAQRPQLLYAVIAILMTTHGLSTTPEFLAGADHLHCTLLSDLLLSLGGPLPKAYTDVLALARVLDECVQEGNVSDPNLIKIQAALRLIFPNDGNSDNNSNNNTGSTNSGEKSSSTSAAATTNKKNTAAAARSNAEIRQLNQIITSGLTALKEADSQNLFLNPVTDSIAPGYSKIIKIPMCVSTMEAKVAKNKYDAVQKWQNDVEIMFKNCITYNRGPAGQWFRDEAHRQAKHFREVILPPRLAVAQDKLSSSSSSSVTMTTAPTTTTMNQTNVNIFNKRDRDTMASSSDQPSSSAAMMIAPLEPVTKKRKKGSTKDEKQLPSMPAMAAMLLCDPFVVRIIIDRILREVRRAVLKGNLLPSSHQVIPSLLQLLHLARWSKQICAVRGRKYFVPSAGVELRDQDEEEEEQKKKDPATLASVTCLRKSLPAIAGLLHEAEFDFRCTSIGGDLMQAAQNAESPPTFKFDFDSSSSSTTSEPAHVTAAVLAGAFVSVCQPGNRTGVALEVTFPKFGATLLHAKASFLDDRLFFGCLFRALVRHRTKLSKAARDGIVATWQSWLGGSSDDNNADTKATAVALTSTAHEHLIKLFNQWSSMGNVLFPRDDLIRFTKTTVEILGITAFVGAFHDLGGDNNNKSQTGGPRSFQKVREQYLYMLKHLPIAVAKQWLSDLEMDHSILGTAAKESQPEAAAAKDDMAAAAAALAAK